MSDIRVDIYSVSDWDGENEVRRWQADVVLPDGTDYHARMATPQDALLELALFWKGQAVADAPPAEPS